MQLVVRWVKSPVCPALRLRAEDGRDRAGGCCTSEGVPQAGLPKEDEGGT